MKKGIDVSHWQTDNFNFSEIANTGVCWCAIKAGGGSDHHTRYTDVLYRQNVDKAVKHNMSVYPYYYGHDLSIESAQKSAEYFSKIIADTPQACGAYYDVEGEMLSLPKNTLTEIIAVFCNKVEFLTGKECGIYTSESHFNNLIDDSRLSHLNHWVAKYSSEKPVLKSGNSVGVWQYGQATTSNGIKYDCNYVYSEITTDKPTSYTFDEMVEKTYRGDFGNGQVRKNAIESLGFSYTAIQEEVNRRYYGIVKSENAPKEPTLTAEMVAEKCYKGEFGNGAVRKAAVEALGYNYNEVQAIVNRKYYGIE